MDPKELAAAVAHLADEKKGEDIQVIDVGERLRVADYFVVVTGRTRPHVKALYNEIHVRMKAAGERHLPVEGVDVGWWVVLDFTDVVVHLMQPEAREYYDLDLLYGDCPRLDWRAVELPRLPLPSQARIKPAG